MKTFIREKKTYCGKNYVEVDIYPYTDKQAAAAKGKRSKSVKVSSPKQVQLNDKNSRRYFIQLANTNFDDNDLHITATYKDEYLPATVEESEKEVANYFRRINYQHMKKGLPNAKYILITEYNSGKDGKPTRIHHHIILSSPLDRNMLEDLWCKRARKGQKKGNKIGFINADRLQPDNNGIAALCNYLTKRPNGRKRWTSSHNLNKPETHIEDSDETHRAGGSRFTASRNLKKPTSRINNHSYSKRELEKIAKNPPDVSYWERRYPGYTLAGDYSFKAEYNDCTGWAVYIKLRKKNETRKLKRQPVQSITSTSAALYC